MLRNKEGKVRVGWKILLMIVAVAVMLLLVSVIQHKLMAVYARSVTNGSEIMMQQKLAELMSFWEVPALAIQNVIMIAVPIFIWKRIIKRPLKDMGLGLGKGYLRELGAGLVFGALSITAAFILLLLVGDARVDSWVPEFSADTFIYLFVFIMVGFGEEISGRGYVMSVMRQTKNIPLIMLVTGVIFSLIHMGNPSIGPIAFLNIFLVGMLFAYMYLKSGNLWMPIGYHITWNYFEGNVYAFPVSGLNSKGIITTLLDKNTIMNGGAFGPEGGLIVTAVVVIGFIVVKWFYRKTKVDFLNMDEIA